MNFPRTYSRKQWDNAYRAARLSIQGKAHDSAKFLLKCAAVSLRKDISLSVK